MKRARKGVSVGRTSEGCSGKTASPRRHTLRTVLLLRRARPVDLGDMGGRVPCLQRFVVAALVENLRQVGSVHLPELLIVIEGGAEVPVFTFKIQEEPSGQLTAKDCEGSHSSRESGLRVNLDPDPLSSKSSLLLVLLRNSRSLLKERQNKSLT